MAQSARLRRPPRLRIFPSTSRHLTYHKVSKSLADSGRLYYEYLYSCGHQRDESSLLKVHQLVSMPSVPCLRTPPRVPVWWP